MEVSGSVLGFGARYPWLLNDGDCGARPLRALPELAAEDELISS